MEARIHVGDSCLARGLFGYLVSSPTERERERQRPGVKAVWREMEAERQCFTSVLRSRFRRRRVVCSYKWPLARSLSSLAFQRVLPERQRDCRTTPAAIPGSPFLSLRFCFWRYFRPVRRPIWNSDYRGVSFQPEMRQSCNIIPIEARISQREHHHGTGKVCGIELFWL